MDNVIPGLNFEICLVNLDDITVFLSDVLGHIANQKAVFEQLKRTCPKLKPSKCKLF